MDNPWTSQNAICQQPHATFPSEFQEFQQAIANSPDFNQDAGAFSTELTSYNGLNFSLNNFYQDDAETQAILTDLPAPNHDISYSTLNTASLSGQSNLHQTSLTNASTIPQAEREEAPVSAFGAHENRGGFGSASTAAFNHASLSSSPGTPTPLDLAAQNATSYSAFGHVGNAAFQGSTPSNGPISVGQHVFDGNIPENEGQKRRSGMIRRYYKPNADGIARQAAQEMENAYVRATQQGCKLEELNAYLTNFELVSRTTNSCSS